MAQVGLMILALAAILVSISSSVGALRRPKRWWTTARTPFTTTSPRLVTGSSQQEWTAKTFPNPQLQPALCSRGMKRSWVCDPNGILSKHQADRVDDLLTQQSVMGHCRCGKKCAKSPSHKGIQGAVALVNKMYFLTVNPTYKELKKAASKFAEYLRDEAWEYELCNDDYVIFVSVKDRQVFTATGDNARPVMTDACVKMVYEEARPMLSQGDFGNALELMVRKYTEVLRFQHRCNRPAGYGGKAPVGSIVGGVLGFLGIASCCGLGCFMANKRRAGSSSSSSGETHYLQHPKADKYHKSESFDHHNSERRGSADSGGAGGGF